MQKRTQKISVITCCTLMLVSLSSAQMVFAEDTTVSNNGAQSDNNATTSSNSQTSVSQSNNANINNSVTSKTSTGDNQTNFNNGNTAIQTGDASSQTVIDTQANQSIVDQSCCQTQSSSTEINGNGAGSQNTTTSNIKNTTNVSVNNNATITTNIVQNLSTGNNKASFNNGDVIIRTGNITSNIQIKNAPVNIAKISFSSDTESFIARISGNGYGTVNTINNYNDKTTVIDVTNAANIINNLHSLYETGGNEANFNNGDVKIITGDITSFIGIFNAVNFNEVTVDCKCEKEKQKDNEENTSPQGGEQASPPTKISSGNGSGESTTSQPTGSFGGELPVTGGNWLILALFGNIMMLLLGAYLRLRSGNSPGLALAI